MEQPSPAEPFRLQNSGRALALDGHDSDLVRHEVMFEDSFTRLKDRRVFVGAGVSRHRLVAAFIVAGLLLSGLLLRAAWMQFGQGAAWSSRADANRFRVDVLPARRGIVRDRNGVILAANVPTFAVRMRESDLPRDAEARIGVVASVARTIGVTTEDVLANLYATGTEPDEWVDVARDVAYDRAVALEIKLPELSGVSLVTSAKRSYPASAETPSLSHILGYVGSISPEEYANRREFGYRRNDEIGKTGLSPTSQIRAWPANGA